jgi:hypothetical protein
VKAWEAQQQRYELAAAFPGCVVYTLTKSMSNSQMPHYLCTASFQKGQPSILQSRKGRSTKAGRVPASFSCPACKAGAFIRWMNAISPKYFEEITPEG